MKQNQTKAIVAIALILLLALSVYRTQQGLGGRSAVIIDQLYGDNLDYGFSMKTRALLMSNGYDVRLYQGEDVTLDLFYGVDWSVDIVVLRMHSGVFDNRTWLFTHEEYDSSKHVLEQLSREANIGICGSVEYPVFTVSSGFFERSIEFDGGLVVVMGCNGLEVDDLGSALMGCGAGAVVGWSGAVTIEETDEVILRFMERVIDGDSIGQSVEGTGLVIFPADAVGFKLG